MFKKRHKKNGNSYIPPYDRELLNKPVAELNIGDALKEILINGAVKDVSGIVKRSEREMFSVKFFSKKYLIELKREMSALGVDFRREEAANLPGAAGAKDGDRPELPAVYRPEPEERDGGLKRFDRLRRGGERDFKPETAVKERRGEAVDKKDARRPFLHGKNGGTFKEEKDSRSRGDGQKIDNNQLKAVAVQKKSGPLSESDWTKYTRNGRWGYVDSSTNQIKIQPIYDEIFQFREGLACAEKNQMFGYIDVSNNAVIPFEYELGMSFKDGLACVTKNGKTGFIDRTGNVVIDFRFDAAMSFEDGVARVKEAGQWADIDKEGKTVKTY